MGLEIGGKQLLPRSEPHVATCFVERLAVDVNYTFSKSIDVGSNSDNSHKETADIAPVAMKDTDALLPILKVQAYLVPLPCPNQNPHILRHNRP
jgi:hypothetical protein